MSAPVRAGVIYRLPATRWEEAGAAGSDGPYSGHGLVFLDASVALRVVELSRPIHVVTPDASGEAARLARDAGPRPPPVGVALAEGRIVTVLVLCDADEPGAPRDDAPDDVSAQDRLPGSDRAVMCELGAEQVAVWGGRVVTTGAFDVAGPGAVRWQGRAVPVLDVSSLYARAEAAIWAARAMRREQEVDT